MGYHDAVPRLIDQSARRAEIAEALWRIVLRDGASGISIREVAAEAGIATGSLRHVFATKEDLLDFSMRLVYERAAERIAAHAGIAEPMARAEAMLAEVIPLDDERRVEMHVNLALITESVAHPRLARAAAQAHDGLRALCRRTVLDLLGDGPRVAERDIDYEAVRLHALIDGLAMHLLLTATESPAAVRRLVRTHLEGLMG